MRCRPAAVSQSHGIVLLGTRGNAATVVGSAAVPAVTVAMFADTFGEDLAFASALGVIFATRWASALLGVVLPAFGGGPEGEPLALALAFAFALA
eukprot:s1810_g1.t1